MWALPWCHAPQIHINYTPIQHFRVRSMSNWYNFEGLCYQGIFLSENTIFISMLFFDNRKDPASARCHAGEDIGIHSHLLHTLGIDSRAVVSLDHRLPLVVNGTNHHAQCKHITEHRAGLARLKLDLRGHVVQVWLGHLGGFVGPGIHRKRILKWESLVKERVIGRSSGQSVLSFNIKTVFFFQVKGFPL